MKIKFKTKNLILNDDLKKGNYVIIPMNGVLMTVDDIGKLSICFDDDFHGIPKNQSLCFYLLPKRNGYWTSKHIAIDSLCVYFKDNC